MIGDARVLSYRGGKVAFGPCFGLMLLLVALDATALGAAKMAPPRVVFLAPMDEPGIAERISLAIEAQLADLEVVFTVVSRNDLGGTEEEQIRLAAGISAEKNAFMVVWCEFKELDWVMLFLSDARGTRVVKRQVDARRDGISGRYEAIGLIVRSAIDIMAIGRIPPRRRHSEEVTARKVSDPENDDRNPSRAIYPFLRFNYAVSGFSSERPIVHNGEIQLGLGLFRDFALVLGYGLSPFIKTGEGAEDEVDLKVHRHSIKVGGRVDVPVGPVRLGGGVLGAIQFLNWHSSTRSDTEEAVGGGWDLVGGIEVFFALGFEITEWFLLDTGPGVLAMIRNSDYSVEYNDTRVVALAPWRFQPFWFVSFCLRLP